MHKTAEKDDKAGLLADMQCNHKQKAKSGVLFAQTMVP